MIEFVFAQNNGGAGPGMGLELIMMLLIVVIGIGGLVLWIWALIDAIRNPALDSTMRIIWVLVILFASLLGAILYLIVGRNMSARNTV